MIINKFIDETTDDLIQIQAIGEEVRILVNGKMATAWFNIGVTERLKTAKDLDEVNDLLMRHGE